MPVICNLIELPVVCMDDKKFVKHVLLNGVLSVAEVI